MSFFVNRDMFMRLQNKWLLLLGFVQALFICLPAFAVDNVILVTIDGVRPEEIFNGMDIELLPHKRVPDIKTQKLIDAVWAEDTPSRRAKLMPFFWEHLVDKGVLFGEPNAPATMRVKNQHFVSGPGYNEILSGKVDPSIARQERVYNPNVTILEWLNDRPEFKDKVAAFTSWDMFPYILNRKRNSMLINSGYEKLSLPQLTERQQLINRLVESLPNQMWEDLRYDTFTFYLALDYLKSVQPRVMYIALGDTDDWGHEGSYPDYLNSIRQADNDLKELWQTLQSMPQYKDNTVLIVTTDHGRGATASDWMHHSKEYPNSQNIWLLAVGPGITQQGQFKGKGDFYQGQTAATIAKVLGLEQAFRGTDKAIMPSLPIG